MRRWFGGFTLIALVLVAGVEAAQHEGCGVVRQRGYPRICVDPVARMLASGEAGAVLASYGIIGSRRTWRLSSVLLAQDRDPIQIGRALFSTACSRCHGAEGVGRGDRRSHTRAEALRRRVGSILPDRVERTKEHSHGRVQGNLDAG